MKKLNKFLVFMAVKKAAKTIKKSPFDQIKRDGKRNDSE